MQDAQKGCPARPQRAKRGESYSVFTRPPIACMNRRLPRPYGGFLSDTRTPLAAFFRILLDRQSLQGRDPFFHRRMSGEEVHESGCFAGDLEGRQRILCAMLGLCSGNPPIDGLQR